MGPEANRTEREAGLVGRARRGDQAAQEELVRIFQREAFGLSCQMLGDRTEAEDIVQEAFFSAFRSLSRLRSAASFRVWFFRIVVNLCYTALRQRGRWAPVEFDERLGQGAAPGGAGDPVGELHGKEFSERVRQAVARLPAQQRAALLLRVFQGLSFSDIALTLRCSEQTVRVHLFLAREKLARELGEGPAPPGRPGGIEGEAKAERD